MLGITVIESVFVNSCEPLEQVVIIIVGRVSEAHFIIFVYFSLFARIEAHEYLLEQLHVFIGHSCELCVPLDVQILLVVRT